MKSKAIIGLVLLLALGVWSTVRLVSQAHDASRAARTADIVRDAIGRNEELEKRFGKFLRMSGEGYERPAGIVLIERIELERAAVFERATVGVHITVFDPPSSAEQGWRIGEWKLETGGRFRYAVHASMQPGAAENAPLQMVDERGP